MKKLNTLVSKLSTPIKRLEKYLLSKGWLDPTFAEKKKKELFSEITKELKRASTEKLPPIDDLFSDVFHTVPSHLQEQKDDLLDHLKRYGDKYNLSKFKDSA